MENLSLSQQRSGENRTYRIEASRGIVHGCAGRPELRREVDY